MVIPRDKIIMRAIEQIDKHKDLFDFFVHERYTDITGRIDARSKKYGYNFIVQYDSSYSILFFPHLGNSNKIIISIVGPNKKDFVTITLLSSGFFSRKLVGKMPKIDAAKIIFGKNKNNVDAIMKAELKIRATLEEVAHAMGAIVIR